MQSKTIVRITVAKKPGYCSPCREAGRDDKYQAGEKIAFLNPPAGRPTGVCIPCGEIEVQAGRAVFAEEKAPSEENGASAERLRASSEKFGASITKEQADKIIKLLTAQLKLLCNVHDERYTDYMKEPEAEKQDFTPPAAKEPTPEEIARQERDRRVAIERAEICSWPPDMYKAYRKRIMNRKPEDEGREIWRTWPAEYAAQQAADENKQQETRFAGKSAPTHHYVNE